MGFPTDNSTNLTRNFQGPVVTDNGGFLVDWIFEGNKSGNWDAINREIKMIPGETNGTDYSMRESDVMM